MLISNSYSVSALSFLLILFEMLFVNGIDRIASNDMTSLDYRINSSSVLEVNGKTNINSFCCTAKETFSTKKLRYRQNSNGSLYMFEDAKLTLQTQNLDCGRKAINKDMKKTLQADKYPNIILHLKEIRNTACNDLSACNELTEVLAVADITITCNTIKYNFPVVVTKFTDSQFRVMGGTTLQLCDFEIEAPTALLGLIKVDDKLQIDFDLFIDIV